MAPRPRVQAFTAFGEAPSPPGTFCESRRRTRRRGNIAFLSPYLVAQTPAPAARHVNHPWLALVRNKSGRRLTPTPGSGLTATRETRWVRSHRSPHRRIDPV